MSIWTKLVTSSQTDDKMRAAGRLGGRIALGLAALAGLVIWTYVVRVIHDYCYAMSASSDGASKRGPDTWAPYIVLWFVPVLLTVLIGLMIRASRARNPR